MRIFFPYRFSYLFFERVFLVGDFFVLVLLFFIDMLVRPFQIGRALF